MCKARVIPTVIFLSIWSYFFCQKSSDQVPLIKRYTQAEVMDSIQGITLFNKLIEPLGGDSVKYNPSGYSVQGWHEEYYTNGKTLHKGFYTNGKLQVFKNYYESGQLERSFVSPDPLNSALEVYYENGLPKLKINYYSGKPHKYFEYYSNGRPKLQIENEKELKYVSVKKTWFESGQMESSTELKDKKEKLYIQKKYYANGQLKEEGYVRLSNDGSQFSREGAWTFYDESGKNKRIEKFKQP